jgi:hypothetical protein
VLFRSSDTNTFERHAEQTSNAFRTTIIATGGPFRRMLSLFHAVEQAQELVEINIESTSGESLARVWAQNGLFIPVLVLNDTPFTSGHLDDGAFADMLRHTSPEDCLRELSQLADSPDPDQLDSLNRTMADGFVALLNRHQNEDLAIERNVLDSPSGTLPTSSPQSILTATARALVSDVHSLAEHAFKLASDAGWDAVLLAQDPDRNSDGLWLPIRSIDQNAVDLNEYSSVAKNIRPIVGAIRSMRTDRYSQSPVVSTLTTPTVCHLLTLHRRRSCIIRIAPNELGPVLGRIRGARREFIDNHEED